MQNAAVILPDQPTRRPFRAAVLRRPTFGRRRFVALKDEGEPRSGWKLTMQDARDFLMAYSACLLAVMGFIA
ncbi:hypothetical protein [Croceicoccus bisphenolivorans]|uniref:hypothetical protein n=1 Tax=Croceicoccus bisphenolivorans TaxID=1783232 RepID=UPI000831F8A2|nr:hypothetical protein [Croceicoccus bisphenolivorans]